MNESTEENRVKKISLLSKDSHSFANPQNARILHLDWQAEVFFSDKQDKG